MLKLVKYFFFSIFIFPCATWSDSGTAVGTESETRTGDGIVAGSGFVSDLSANASARTFPTGGGITGKAGVSHLLWGLKENPTDFKYGLLRAQLSGSTSLAWNQINTEIELYPISFLGISGGSATSRSSVDSKEYECSESISCQSMVRTQYGKIKFVFGAKGIFLRLEQTQGTISSLFDSGATSFIDFENTLRPLTPRDDYRRENTVVAFTQDRLLIYFLVHDQMQNRFSGSHYSYDGIGFQRREDKTAWTFIFGVADSSILRKDIGFIFSYEWNFKSGLKLF